MTYFYNYSCNPYQMKKQSTLLLIFILCIIWCQAQYDNDHFSKLKIAVSGGYAYRLGKKPSGDQYYKDISHGPVFTSDLTWFWNQKNGAGIHYSYFTTSGTSNNLGVNSNINIQFIGPVYRVQSISANEKWQVTSGIGLGYMSYTDKGWINFGMPGSSTIKGASLGSLIEAGVDYKIVKGLSAGINLNLHAGYLSRINHNGSSIKLDSKNRESLSRIEGAGGLRYSF
mgnify:CR=1 FL=1